MEYKKFRELDLSRLGMGNMRLPTEGDNPAAPIDRRRAQAIIDYAMANGINYFDTGYVYHGGESEAFLGEALKKYPRDSYYLATKYFAMADADYKRVFETQLERLQTDYIDFYLIHGIFDNSFQQYIDCGCIEYLLEEKKKGRIKYLGFSSHASPENLRTFANHHDWDFAQIQLNYFDWVYGPKREEYEILAEKKLPIMVMEPVRGGRLASLTPDAEALLHAVHPDWSIASWALRWVRHLPQTQVILSGMSALDQIENNVATFSDAYTWTESDEQTLMKACEMFHDQVRIPCTACRYCCDNCPKKINIPAYLAAYNAMKINGEWTLLDLIRDIDSVGEPKDCVACGSCTKHCPQSIGIPALMKELAGVIAMMRGE